MLIMLFKLLMVINGEWLRDLKNLFEATFLELKQS